MSARFHFLRAHLLKVVGLLLLVWLLARSDLGKIAREIRSLNPRIFLLSLLMFVPAMWFRAMRWRILLVAGSGARLSRGDAFRYYLSALFLGVCTPGRLGEVLKVSYARKAGATLGGAVAATLMDRLLDLALLVVLGCVTVVAHYGAFSRPALGVLGFLIAGSALLGLLLASRRTLQRVLETVACRVLSQTRMGDARREGAGFESAFRSCNLKLIAKCSALTAAASLAYYVERYLQVRAIGIDMGFAEASMIMTVVAFLALVPISVINIGPRDAALIVFLADAGVSRERAIALSSVILMSILIEAAGCAPLFFSGRKG